MTGRFKVVGHCALFTTTSVHGPAKVTVYRGQMVPDGATDAEVRHNLSMGLIRPVGERPQAAAPRPADPPAPAAPAVEELSEERKAARAKLPADGSAPHPNAAEATWVEYAVAKGYDYTAAKAAGKAELVALLRQG